MSPTFLLLLFKVRFYRKLGEHAPFGLTAAVTDMQDQGLEQVCNDFQSLDDASKQGVSAHSWLRGVLFRGFFEQVSKLKAEAWVDDLPALEKDVSSVLALLRGWKRPELIAVVALDLEAVLVLLDAAGASPRYCPSQVDAAVKSLNAPHMQMVQRAFGEHDAGQALLEAACGFMARSAEDEAADSKLRAAVEFVTDDLLPRLVAGEEGGTALTGDFAQVDVDLINFALVRVCNRGGRIHCGRCQVRGAM